jgi:hypothetical protein
MVELTALWKPILVSVACVFVALVLIHALLGWHKADMVAIPNETQFMDAVRALNVPPGEYRFPYSNSTSEMRTPEWDARMQRGPVGIMTMHPNGGIDMGKMFGLWLVYSLVISMLAAYVTGRTRGVGATYLDVFRISGTVAFCCYVMAHWQNWIWWGRSTRYTITQSIDGIIFALVTAGCFGWLWPR